MAKTQTSTIDLVEAQMKDFKPVIPITAQEAVEEYEHKKKVPEKKTEKRQKKKAETDTDKNPQIYARMSVFAKTLSRLQFVNSLLVSFGEKKLTGDDIINKWLDKNLKTYSPKVYGIISRVSENFDEDPAKDEADENPEEESWIEDGV